MRKMDAGLLDKFNEIERVHWWWEGRRELLKILLKGKSPARVLDVGCGTGETLSFLGSLFPKAALYGLDTSLKAVEFSRGRGHAKTIKGKAEKLHFPDNYFDIVLFLDVLEHIEHDSVAVGEAKRVLRRNGVIVITAPALSLIWSDHDTMQGHKRRYTRHEIRKLASDNKLKIIFLSYFNFFLSPPIVMIRLLSRLSSFNSLASYDRSVNYDIAKISLANRLLKFIFVNEIRLLNYIKYPIGVSVAAVFKKTANS